MRPVPEGGVALRRNVARLAGFRARRGGTFRLQKAASVAPVISAVANGAASIGFPTYAWTRSRTIVPLGVE